MTDVHSAVGSYVVDALDVAERAEFEAHLSSCESCRQEILEFEETIAELVRLVSTRPPAALRERVVAAVSQARPLPPTLSTPAPSPNGDASQDDLAERRSWRRTPVLTAAVAAATVIALALGGWVYILRQQGETLAAERQAEVAARQKQADLLRAPDARVLTTTAKGARYSFVVSQERNAALFLGTDLEDPGPGKTYQLWTLQGTTAFPDQLVRGYGRTSRWFSGSVDSSTALAVSVEPAAGSTSPTKAEIQALVEL